MENTDRFSAALKYAAEKHEGQYRIGGKPYISHPVEVASILSGLGYSEEYQIAALFHDLLEDTDAAEEEIERIGGPAVLKAVKLLTKEKDYDMAEYIARIKNDPIAFKVKAADRLHNLRSAADADESFRRRYILESVRWYIDFSPEIPQAIKELSETLNSPPPCCELITKQEI